MLEQKVLRVKVHFVNLLHGKVLKDFRIFKYPTQENWREEPAESSDLNIIILESML